MVKRIEKRRKRERKRGERYNKKPIDKPRGGIDPVSKKRGMSGGEERCS